MLKKYSYNGKVFQWEEGMQPKGAVEVSKPQVSTKEAKPKNKARKAKCKDGD